MALLEVENLEVSIVTQGKLLPVVESISFEVTGTCRFDFITVIRDLTTQDSVT